MRFRLFGCIATFVLFGCCQQEATLQPIDTSAIAPVQAEIKRQVGIYMAAARRLRTEVTVGGKQVPVDDLRGDFACGKGSIDFDLSAVKAELTTTVDTTTDKKAGLVIPVSSITFGPSAESKTDRSNTQTLDFNLWPLAQQNQDVFEQNVTRESLKEAPLASAILGLRDALILAAMKHDYQSGKPVERGAQPCFTDYDPQKPAADAGNAFKMALSITDADNINGISIGVSVLTLSATGESKSTTGNTLTVSFVQRGLEKIQYLRDAVDAECKYPKGYPNGYDKPPSADCQGARKALADAMSAGEGVGIEAAGPQTQ